MKKNTLLLVMFSLVLFLSACINTITGEGPVVIQERKVEPFNKIALNANIKVLIHTGASQTLKISAQQNILDVIVTRIDGKTLVITTKGNVISNEPIIIETGMINPESFELNGSGEIKSEQLVSSEILDVEVNGSGIIDMEIQANKLTSSVSGSGRLKLRGNSDDFKIQINGSGEADANALQCQSASATLNGSGEVRLNVVDKMKATINGSGKISYKGSPDIKSTINGSGSISRENN